MYAMVDMESGSVKDESEKDRDDLNFSWDNLPNKFMREDYKLTKYSQAVSEEIKVWKLTLNQLYYIINSNF